MKPALCLQVTACALLFYSSARASELTGDTVVFAMDPDAISPTTVVVGAGDDFVLGTFHFDFNAGAGDEFLWTSSPVGGSLGGGTDITLSSLDFTDGSSLVGFDLLSTNLLDLTQVITPHSITFDFTTPAGFTDVGTVLDGRFITVPAPEPSTFVLTIGGLAALVAFRWRQRQE